jgi:hypothetical protein
MTFVSPLVLETIVSVDGCVKLTTPDTNWAVQCWRAGTHTAYGGAIALYS